MSDLGTIAGTTSLAQALHALWAANSALVAVVPADRAITGRVPPSEEMPYVRLSLADAGNKQRTNATLYQAQRVSFHLWTDTFDAGDAAAPLIQAAFASMAFNWGSGGVTDMRQEGTPATTQTTDPEIKAWETTVTFTANTWQTRQDN